jgi:hypothetical protein
MRGSEYNCVCEAEDYKGYICRYAVRFHTALVFTHTNKIKNSYALLNRCNVKFAIREPAFSNHAELIHRMNDAYQTLHNSMKSEKLVRYATV